MIIFKFDSHVSHYLYSNTAKSELSNGKTRHRNTFRFEIEWIDRVVNYDEGNNEIDGDLMGDVAGRSNDDK